MNSILEDFQKLPNQDLICNFIISNRNQIDNYSNIYGLILLEQFLEKKWESINEKEKINFLEFLTKILINDVVTDNKFKNKFYINKLNSIIVLIAKKEMTKNWGSFITDMCSLSSSNPNLCENNLKILYQLNEDINIFSKYSITSQEIIELKQKLNNDIQYIFNLCENILLKETNYMIIKNCLKLLSVYIPYFPKNQIFNEQFLNMLLKLLKQKNLRIYVFKCIGKIFSLQIQDDNEYYIIHQMILKLYKDFIELIYDITKNCELGKRFNLISDEKKFGFEKFILSFENCLIDFFKNNFDYYEKINSSQNKTIINEFLEKNLKVLSIGLEYLFQLLNIQNKQIFFISLNFWYWISLKIFFSKELNYPIEQFNPNTDFKNYEPYINYIKDSIFFHTLYLPFLNKLRNFLITEMKKPNELKIIIKENGNLKLNYFNEVSEIMKNNLILLTFLDHIQTINIIQSKFDELYNEHILNENLLNSLSNSFSLIANIIEEKNEVSFIVSIINYLLNLCEKVNGIKNKSICAENILFSISQYPKFLSQHSSFFKSYLNKIFHFFIEKDLQNLAVKTFLKISKNCGNVFIVLQKNETKTYVDFIFKNISRDIYNLKKNQQLIFFESIGNIINHEKDINKKKKLIDEFINYFHDNWIEVFKKIEKNYQLLKNRDICIFLNDFILINRKLFESIQKDYFDYFSQYFENIIKIYDFYSNEINAYYQGNNQIINNICYFILINKNLLKLISSIITNIEDMSIVENILLPNIRNIINCYINSYPKNKNPYIFKLLKKLISIIGNSENDINFLQSVWENLCLSSINYVRNTLMNDYKFAQNLFDLIYSLIALKFEIYMKIQQYQINENMISMILESIKINDPNISHKAYEIMKILLKNIKEKKNIDSKNIITPFLKQYYLIILSIIVSNLIESDYSFGFKEKIEIFQILIHIIQDNNVEERIFQIEGNNKEIIVQSILDEISKKKNNINKKQIIKYCQQLFNNSHDNHLFKTILRDLLISVK